ncbi:MAG: hypothetical protein A3J93_03280 [Candidatus Magasanikbacteria bacterium RIFOXYC2_FULL_42_28]|uniref:Uncharacterized protein n=1 Tax=Candidatus Magasanikbacteria bacterium RIFOXYC2_FULL_42_28 TaxID=1798704 RepID=A0A1F6NV70_9BACT|nr:MAG: hypothetical protein A3J93_03280 [Candidatus Magasanikbacteria bacterium RIFOXYC2_FULL_42_28]
MARATMIVIGPGGKSYHADQAAVQRVLCGEARRMPVYTDEVKAQKGGRPDAKFRAGQVRQLRPWEVDHE